MEFILKIENNKNISLDQQLKEIREEKKNQWISQKYFLFIFI